MWCCVVRSFRIALFCFGLTVSLHFCPAAVLQCNAMQSVVAWFQVCGGHVGAVRWLLSKGAGNVHATDRFGRSALAEARKKAKLPYPFDHHKAVLRLLEAHIDFSDDVARAQTCRDEGNALFRSDSNQFKRAAVKYTESLQWAADHRTFSNRSQCYLNIAREHRETESNFQCRNKGKEFYRDLFQRALADAEAARAMEPLLLKSHHRAALALLGLGAVHSALEALHAGLQSCSVAERSGGSTESATMMADILGKLQLTELDLQSQYGCGYGGKSKSHLSTSISGNNVYFGNNRPAGLVPDGDSSFSLAEVPSNMCMWCETLLPASMLQEQEQEQQAQRKYVSSAPAEPLPCVSRNLLSSGNDIDIGSEIVSPSSTATASAKQERGGSVDLLCPLCFCSIHDKMSPQLLRDRYLGGNTVTSSVV